MKTTQKIVKLRKDTKFPNGLEFKAHTEFEIVTDVVYMQGFPVPPNIQPMLLRWITENPQLFFEDQRRFK